MRSGFAAFGVGGWPRARALVAAAVTATKDRRVMSDMGGMIDGAFFVAAEQSGNKTP